MAIPVERVTIIGMGLIGGSLGMALTQSGVVPQVTGVDCNEETLELALQTRAAHHVTSDLKEGIAGAQVVVLATPVGTYPQIITAIKPWLQAGAVVTDVGSAKAGIVTYMEEHLPPGVFFVGGHPMAGSERTGIQAADRYLFENAVYALTPSSQTDPGALKVVNSLVSAIGARVVTLRPEEHDMIVAAVSHLPHLLAVAMVNTAGQVAREYPNTLMLAAGGFRDTTRVASGDSYLWRDICLANDSAILQTINLFRNLLDDLEDTIRQRQEEALVRCFDSAREIRNQIPARMKGILPSIYEVVVTVPDRPGMIGDMAQVLGQAGINIIDIEILRVREGDGGTIRLGFQSQEAADQAVTILRGKGIVAKRR